MCGNTICLAYRPKHSIQTAHTSHIKRMYVRTNSNSSSSGGSRRVRNRSGGFIVLVRPVGRSFSRFSQGFFLLSIAIVFFRFTVHNTNITKSGREIIVTTDRHMETQWEHLLLQMCCVWIMCIVVVNLMINPPIYQPTNHPTWNCRKKVWCVLGVASCDEVQTGFNRNLLTF